jgi:hypothetical protein
VRNGLDAIAPRRELLFDGPMPGAARRRANKLKELWSRPVTVTIAAVLVVCALIGFVIGRSLSGNDNPAARADNSTHVSGGHLTLSSVTGWENGRAPRQVTELVRSARVVEPSGMGVSVVLGDVAPDQVPKLIAALGLKTSSATDLSAGSTSARSYTGKLPGSSPRSVTALLVPSSAGISTAICLGDARMTWAAEDCQTVLTTTASLRNADPAAVTPAKAEVLALRSSIIDLNSRRARDAAALDAATTSGRQANAAQLLGADYRAAATRASGIKFTPLASGSGRSLVKQLSTAAAAYTELARAADGNSSAGYVTALNRATKAEATIEQSLLDLAAFGYGSGKR